MNKICEREPYSSRILASLLSRASKLFRGYGGARREKEILPLFPFPSQDSWGSLLAGHLIWLAVDSVFAARELQEITLSIASLLLNCFVNLAPLGLYSSLIFSLMLKKIHRETLLKLVQQTNMRNWRTCVWNRKSKSWFVILEVPDYVTRKKLRVKKERYLLIRERNDYNLGEKWWDFRTFLPTERLSRRFGTAMTPPLAPPWSKLFSRNQKWCSRTSTLFFFSAGRGSIRSCQFFQELYLETAWTW